MRQIKFRYTFQDGIGCCIKHKDFTLKEIEDNKCLFDCWKLLARRQFAGLKDKNGKEIYEGDIIGIKGKDKMYYYSVEYSEERGMFMLNAHVDGSIIGYINFMDYNEEEVIGNIYENPELLKK